MRAVEAPEAPAAAADEEPPPEEEAAAAALPLLAASDAVDGVPARGGIVGGCSGLTPDDDERPLPLFEPPACSCWNLS